jgi:hypothetical protein
MYGSGWYGYRGYRRRGWGGGWLFFPLLFLMGFLFFKVMWALLPLLLIGVGVWILTRHSRWSSHYHRWDDNSWDEGKPKRKNGVFVGADGEIEEKRKNDEDDTRYAQTADGEWVQIV